MEKCPFCCEPKVSEYGIGARFRCGTRGPDINGEYDVGHTCDITIWTRILAEKDAEIERLKRAPTWLCSECQDQWNAAEEMKQHS